MERPQPDQERVEIPRNSPRIKANLGGKSLELTWYNSLVQLYRDPYKDMSHLRVEDEEAKFKALVFGNPSGAKSLIDRGFPVRMDCEPSVFVLDRYAEIQQRGLSGEIIQLLEGGEQ